MNDSSKISEFVKEILATLRGRSIGGIWDIKSFRLNSDLKKDPIVNRFFTLANDLIDTDRETSNELMYSVFLRLEDFFQFIINGYYSTNNLDLLQRISDFLEVYIAYCAGIPWDAKYLIEQEKEFMLDYNSLVYQGLKDISIYIRNEQLITFSRNRDPSNDFILNIEKIYEDCAYKQHFFQNHIRHCYYEGDLNEILEEHPIFNYIKNQLELKDLGINTIHDIKGFNTIKILRCLDLSNNPISDLSGIENFPFLEIIKINNTNISKIDILKNLSDLRILELNNNKIIEITGLESLTKLEDLQLEKNNIRDINSIRNLENLVKLNLRDNNISDLNGIDNLVRLKELDLRGNKIFIIKNVDFLTGIKKLYMDPFESYLPEEESQVLRYIEVNGGIKFKIFNNLTIERNNVIHLKVKPIPSITKINIEKIIKETKKLGKLKKFEFYLENFSTFPEELCKIYTLKELILSENKFNSVPESIINLKRLKKLDLGYNRLTSLPLAFVRLDSLEFLDLSYNRIKQLPRSIGNFKSLKTLILQGNELAEIPKSIKKIKTLKKVNLKGNDFTSEPQTVRKLKDQGVEVLITYN